MYQEWIFPFIYSLHSLFMTLKSSSSECVSVELFKENEAKPSLLKLPSSGRLSLITFSFYKKNPVPNLLLLIRVNV